MAVSTERPIAWTRGWTVILLAPFAAALVCVHFLHTPLLRGMLIPPERWDIFHSAIADLPQYFELAGAAAAVSAAFLLLDATRRGWRIAVHSMAIGSWWLFAPLAFITAFEAWRAYGVSALGPRGATVVGEFLVMAHPFVVSAGLAGYLCSLMRAIFGAGSDDRWKLSMTGMLFGAATYAAVFTALAALQHEALHVPHGDTGMYEEHLWNVEHGKGFRSELDSGRLFLGERFQLIHLLLIPVHLLRPALTTLNACESIALASTAAAVWWMARSNGLGSSAALSLSLATLAYYPLQYLDQELTWKTFRPNSFGVPLTAFALACHDAGRLRTCAALFAFSFLAAEDYSIAALGFAGSLLLTAALGGSNRKASWKCGLLIGIGSVVFLALALTVLIPYFRGGQSPHYTPYFKSLGSSPGEIVVHLLRNPRTIFERIMTASNGQFLLLLLAPLAMTPALAPIRVLAAAPVVGYLILGEREGMNQPFFHFHGPLVGLILWACVGGCALLSKRIPSAAVGRFVFAMALTTGFWYGPSPCSWKFHDPLAGVVWRIGDPMGPTFKPAGQYWRDRYQSPERAVSFARAWEHIDVGDRVAATDYVRSRFTHHAACHEYPPLKDHVSIDDVDVIVLDLAEGYWGRGESNADRELLALARNPSSKAGDRTIVRGKPGGAPRDFEVVYRDRWFLVIRRVS